MYPGKIVEHFMRLPSGVKVALMVGGDALFLPICMLLASSLRLGSFENGFETALSLQVMLAWFSIPSLALAHLYRTVVRYIDLRVLLAASIALGGSVLATYVIARVIDMTLLPRSTLIIYWFIAFTYVVTSRFVVRAMLHRSLSRGRRPRVNCAIYGAGFGGVQLARAMQYSFEYRPVCFFDDRPDLHRKTVAALPVFSSAVLADKTASLGVEEIVIAIPSATPTQKRELMERVAPLGLPVKILPGITDWMDGTVGVSDIRDIDVADLLGRDPVPADPKLIGRNIAGKTVLVTGAGGSIGSELCRQVVSQRPAKLVLLDHSEFALYSIDRELRALAPELTIVAKLGSVLDRAGLDDMLRRHGVQTVYHAAAYKHVPLVEANIQQGVRNNVFGSVNVAHAAAAAGVETCILISTDKAVRPTNAMGASKRVAELVFQAAALSHPKTTFAMVRFGNVLGSSGSVVPLFRQQILDGGPITITHPDIIRYFMLIPEAAQLVIQAGAMSRSGEVFVLDMGEPVRIVDLARSMIRLSGLNEKSADHPDGDIEIKAVGLRPGEKLYEELLIGDEVVPSGHPRIMCARERHIDPSLLDKMLATLDQGCVANDDVAMRRQLHHLVPEFRDAEEVNAEALRRGNA